MGGFCIDLLVKSQRYIHSTESPPVIIVLLWCSIGSDEDDGSEEASVDDPSETAVSRDAAKELSHGVYTLLRAL